MKQVAAFVTSDGTVFTDMRDAKKYAEARYSDALLRLARELCQIDKYSTTAAFIDARLDDFTKLAALKADCLLPKESEDEC